MGLSSRPSKWKQKKKDKSGVSGIAGPSRSPCISWCGLARVATRVAARVAAQVAPMER